MQHLRPFLRKIANIHRKNGFTVTDLFAMLACAFVCASFTGAAAGDFTSLAWVRQMPPLLFWGTFLTVLIFVWAGFLLAKTTRIINWCLLVSGLLYSLLLVGTLSGDLFFNIGVGAVMVLIAKYVTSENRLGLENTAFSWRASLYITAAVFCLFCLFVSFCTVAKYKAFAHGTFDFGIFCQMFEQMAKTGLPYTTVERSRYLSHFAVHFSPIYYLLLPGYLIFRSPVYLLCAQAVIVGLGMFPLRRICRTLGLSPLCAAGAAVLYALYPSMANGCFYDFHENKFLSVLLLYMISFILEQKRIPAAVSALLVLCVKEDAFIYVMAVALWMLLSGRDRWFAVGTAAASLLWFVFACSMIRLSGGEIMSDRFANFTASADGGGLLSTVRTCFYNIGYLIREVFSGAETEAYQELTYSGQKLEFVLWLCAPLLFTPFAGKRSVQLVLLIPLLAVNLMPDWMYQFDIDFQYTYGTAALLIVSAMLTVSGWGPGGRRLFFCSALSLCMIFSVSAVLPKAQRSVTRYYQNKEEYDITAAVLKQNIPADASVTAYGYMMPHLYYVDDLHACPDYYAPLEQTEYYVLDTRYDTDSHTKKMLAAMGNSYTLIIQTGYVQIYRLENAVQ